MNNKSGCKRFNTYAWKMLLSFGFVYLFFYSGRQNINLVMTEMAEDFNSTTTAFGLVKETFGWIALFITIGCLYIVILVLTKISSKIKVEI